MRSCAVIKDTGTTPELDVFSRLEKLRFLRRRPRSLLQSARDVVIVASSSRGGSSMFIELLRQSDALMHLRGEINPLITIAANNRLLTGQKINVLDERHVLRDLASVLDAEMTAEVSRTVDYVDEERLEEFALDLCWRLTVQWPELAFEPDTIRRITFDTMADLRAKEDWESAEFKDHQIFHAYFLRRVRQQHPSIDPYYYDFDRDILREFFPEVSIPRKPPSFIIEEPPYILIRPGLPASFRKSEARPLIIKTPSNAYQLRFLRSLFPNARFRVFHLTRNPAGAINGLYDGWRHWGFHSYKSQKPFAIEGYVDYRPADKHWWKFDLPPGWWQMRNRPLQEVCAFQWVSAHNAILDFIEESGCDYHRLAVEDVMPWPGRRRHLVEEACEWLGIPVSVLFRKTLNAGMRPVMATVPPRPWRWKDRQALMHGVLNSKEVNDTATRIGTDDQSRWI